MFLVVGSTDDVSPVTPAVMFVTARVGPTRLFAVGTVEVAMLRADQRDRRRAGVRVISTVIAPYLLAQVRCPNPRGVRASGPRFVWTGSVEIFTTRSVWDETYSGCIQQAPHETARACQ